MYGAWQQAAYVLFIVYIGVVISDMLTFCIGLALRQGLLKPLKDKLLPKNSASITKAEQMITKWSNYIGAVQRFSLGFRGPLCLLSGFTGVPAAQFATGASIGALGTMPIQLTIGYFLRNAPNVYLSSLALVAIPNIIGNYVGPLAFGLVTAVRMKQRGGRQGDSTEEEEKQT
ncbi:hypothetical protein COCSUDRAFT_83682 [Coccomyxa subellipsoidea C-169]|uniref:Uncharacterized protein n=1 Tax=Coccomyxa subellipsoidea (strain C-169) TaxID=574566 RepID=I0Z159_COCSC|nr:hypothetical protein COCSUDRAFT_83682 [Coccomyxa subellipsoidea C-169]EIE24378.1 hypothetical protein COCSUDRAFT_83682 [Coccomyxa subellipsoidea C-169]|eukprot:XP_005648922.1 hypothetical protein COCSUDRAFT_83682 [Coccomyxa subellipsoidea C-169]